MTDVHVSLPPALRRAVDLLADPPANPDVSKGYLDLLSSASAEDAAIAKNTGSIQAAWASPIGSMLYDNAQALGRRLISAWRHPVEWLNIPAGGLTPEQVHERLASRGAAPELLRRLEEFYRACDLARFAPSGTGGKEMSRSYREATEILEDLRRARW